MKKQSLLLILGIAVLALVLLLIGLPGRSLPAALAPSPAVSGEQRGETAVSAERNEQAEAYLAEYPAESYLLLTTASGTRMPIPLNEDAAFRITQADGSENVIHIGKNAFYMQSSNCENQNCVQQGEVTLENRDTRLLLNMVICLPHALRLELVTREEARSFLLEAYAALPEGAGE